MFNWIKNFLNKKSPVSDNSEPVNKLHNFDLDKWHYLGSTEMTWQDSKNTVSNRCCAFFFLNKKTDKRDLTVVGTSRDFYEDHRFYYHSCQLWKTGETPLYNPIHSPSNFLKKMMLEKFGWTWDEKKNWWGPAGPNEKYTAAKEKQAEEKKKPLPVKEDDGKVIKLTFKGEPT